MNIYKKLFNIQQELRAPKDLHNSFANYNYRTTEAILEAAKPLLKENNLIILLDDEVETRGEYNYIRATAKIVDIETGEHIETSALAREDKDRKKLPVRISRKQDSRIISCLLIRRHLQALLC